MKNILKKVAELSALLQKETLLAAVDPEAGSVNLEREILWRRLKRFPQCRCS